MISNSLVYVAAEARYRSALSLNEELVAMSARHGWYTDFPSSRIMNGLADSLAGQQRYAEAEELYKSILGAVGPDDPAMVEFLEHYAALECQMGNRDREQDLLVQARAIRAGP